MTGMLSLRAFVAKVFLNAGAGSTMNPTGMASSMASLGLKGAALACRVQSGSQPTWGILRLSD